MMILGIVLNCQKISSYQVSNHFQKSPKHLSKIKLLLKAKFAKVDTQFFKLVQNDSKFSAHHKYQLLLKIRTKIN